jgi:hypothetical protein
LIIELLDAVKLREKEGVSELSEANEIEEKRERKTIKMFRKKGQMDSLLSRQKFCRHFCLLISSRHNDRVFFSSSADYRDFTEKKT